MFIIQETLQNLALTRFIKKVYVMEKRLYFGNEKKIKSIK